MLQPAAPFAVRRRAARPRLTPLARGLLAACLLSPLLSGLPAMAGGPLPANALPGGLQVVRGQASVSTQGSQMTVRNTPSAILDWQSFSIGSGSRVYFDQASAASKVLNRVTGNDPSQIFGSLGSNGQVWLLNPNGVLFGAGARVDVASLVTSTLRLNDSDFLAGRYRFGSGDAAAATLRNEGALQSSFGGQVVLLGGKVENTGSIQAPGGQVTLAAARSVELVDTGLPNLAVRVDVPAGETLNLGRLAAPGGKVDVYGAIVNQQGLVSAGSLNVGEQGRIVLRAAETLTLGAASRTEAAGGDITLSAHDVALQGQAVVDASGAQGGGRIRVGGGFQGKDSSIGNASTVQVDAGVRLAADALQQGDGGQVIVWSDDVTRFDGHLSARGAGLGGNGGSAEVSGKHRLTFGGGADLRGGKAGRSGSLLLDPDDLCIVITSPTGACAGTAGSEDTSNPFQSGGGTGSFIKVATLQGLGDVALTLQAGNDIIFQTSVDLSAGLLTQPVSLTASNAITMNGFGITTGGGGIALTAGTGGITGIGNLNAGSGTLTVNSSGATAQQAGTKITGSTSLRVSGGTLTLSNVNDFTGTTTIDSGATLKLGVAGAVPGGTNATINGTLDVNGLAQSLNSLAGAGTVDNTAVGAVTLTVGGSGSSVFSGVIRNSGGALALAKIGSGTLTLGGAGANTYTGATTVSAGTLEAAKNQALGTTAAGTTVSSGATLLISGVNIGSEAITLSGSGVASAGALQGSGASAASGTVTLSGATTIGVAAGGDSLSLTGAIGESVSSALTKTGSGTLTLGGVSNNTYTGLTTVSAGTLEAAKNQALGTTAAGTTVSSGATLLISGVNIGSEAITLLGSGVASAGALQGTGTSLAAGTITLAADATLAAVGGADTLTLGSVGQSGGTRALTTVGSGTIVFGAVATYGGATTIGSGSTLRAGASGVLPSGSAATINGTLDINGLSQTLNSIAGPGTIDNTAISNATLTLGGSGSSTFSGVIQNTGGALSLTKSGAGTLTLTGSNTYGGTTTISAGTLQLGSGGTSGTAGSGSITDNATLTINRSDNFTLVNPVGGGGALVQSGSGTTTLTASNTYSGTTTISAGALQIGNGGTSGTPGTGAIVNNTNLYFNRSDTLTVANAISGTGILHQVGTGVTQLTQAGTYSGDTGIVAGTLSLSGSGRPGTGSVVVFTGGTLDISGGATISNTVVGSAGSTLTNNSGSGTLTGPLNLTGSGISLGSAGSGLTISGVIGDGGSGFGFTKIGTGTVTLTAANTYSGTTTIAAGTLQVGNGGSTGTLGSGPVVDNATLAINRSGAFTLGNSIGGTGGLTQAGSGTTSVTGNNSYGGPTTVTSGTLSIDAAGAANLASLSLQGGSLTGSANIVIAGNLDVTGASGTSVTGSGSITTQGTTTVNLSSGGGFFGLNRNWTNNGSFTLGGDDFIYLGYPSGGSTTFTNAAGGTLNFTTTNTSTMVNYSGTTTINNAGTLTLNASGTHALTPATLNNSGSIALTTGTLTVGAAGTDTGTYAVASGSTLNFNAGTRTLGSGSNISGAGALVVSGGTFSTNGALDIANTGSALTVTSGTATLAGSLSGTVAPISVSGGTLNLGGSVTGTSGAVTIAGGTLNINSSSPVTLPSLTLTSGSLGGTANVTVSGNLDITGSNAANITGSGSFTTQGTTTVNLSSSAGGFFGLNRNWTNQGTFNLAGDDYVYLGYPGGGTTTFTNAAGATLNLGTSNTSTLINYSGTNIVNNAGTINLTVSGNHNLTTTSFTNTGAVNLVSGSLSIVGSGTDTGTYAVASGSTLDFSSGTRTLDVGSSLSGSGTLSVSGSSTVNGNGSLGLLTTGAAITVSNNGTLNLGGTVSGTIVPVTVNNNATLNFNNTSPVTVPSMVVNGGTVSGSGNVTVSGNLDLLTTYASFTGSGSLTTQGTTTVNLASTASGWVSINRTWNNTGTFNLAGDDFIYLGYPSGGTTTFTNAAGATLNLGTTNTSTLINYTGTNIVNNAGTINHTVGGSHSFTATTFNNTGAVNVNSGSLSIGGSGTDTGTYAVVGGSTLDFSSGTRTLDVGSSLSGSGTLSVSGSSTVNGNGSLGLLTTGAAITVSNNGTLNLGGTVSGTIVPVTLNNNAVLNFNNTSPVTVPSMVVNGGTVSGSGNVTVSGNLDLLNTYAYFTGSGSLTTQGTTTVNLAGTAGGWVSINRTWNNTGTFNLAGDDFVYLGYPSGGTTTFTNAAGATLNLGTSNSNTLINYTGTNIVNNAGTMNLTASGSHTLSATTFNNTGTVNLTAGTLSINAGGTDTGSYAVAGGNTLDFSGGTRTLDVNSSVSGSGTLSVSGNSTVNGNGSLGLLTTGAAITVSNNGTLNLGGTVSGTIVPVTVNNNATLNFNNTSAVTLPSLNLAGGTVGGSGDLVVSGPFNVTTTYGTLTGSGSITTQGTSTVNLASVANGFLGVSRNWQNTGTLNVAGDDFIYFGYASGGNNTLTNVSGATLNLSTSYSAPLQLYTGTPLVVNAGTLNQTASGSHTIGVPFNNNGTVNVTAGTLSLTGNGSDSGLYALSAGTTLNVANGTRTLGAGSSLSGTGALSVSGGTLNVNATLDFSNTPVSVSNGTLNFNDTSAVSLPSLNLAGGTVGGTGDIVVRGNLDVTTYYANLTGTGTLTTQGVTTVNMPSYGSAFLGLSRNWQNTGTLNIGGDDFIYMGYPSAGITTLSNAAGATINLGTSYSVPIQRYSGTNTLVNAGTLNQSAAASHQINVDFNNTGSVNITAGTLSLNGNGSDSGVYTLSAGTTLDIAGGTRALNAGSAFAGTGTLSVSGGTLSLNTALDLSRLAVNVSGGTLNFNDTSPATLPSLALTGGTVGGSGDLVVTGNLDITGSYATLTGSGSLTSQGTSTVNLASVSNGYLALSRNWLNTGTLTIGGDDLVYFGLPSGGTSTLTNGLGATLNLASSYPNPLLLYSGTQTVVNNGTLNQTATGSHAINVPFNNNGTVNVSTGTLALANNGSDSGSYVLSAGTTLSFSSGTRTLGTGSSVLGTGTLNVSGGTLNVSAALNLTNTPVTVTGGTLNFNGTGTANLGSLSLTGGSALGGSGNVNVTGAFNVTDNYAYLTGSGTFTTQGTTTVNLASVGSGYLGVNKPWSNSGTLTLGGDDLLYFGYPGGGGTFNNLAGGTVNVTSSYVSPLLTYFGTTGLSNAGTLNLQSTGTHNLVLSSLTNTGTLNVQAGTWTTSSSAITQSGLLNIASGATFAVPGSMTNQAGGTLAGTGTLQVSGTLTNQGTISPGSSGSAGTLAVTGNVALSSGTLAADLGGTGAGASDLLAVSGNVTVAGNLTANLIGGYTPAGGDFVPIISAGGTSSGTFSGLSVPLGFTAGYKLAAGEAARLIFAGASTKVFTNAAGDLNWATAANWSGTLPDVQDTALISAGYAVVHASGTDSIAGLTINSGNSLNVSGGSLAVSGTTAVGGTLTVSGTGAATLSGGLTGAGAVNVQGGSLQLAGGATMASLNLSGGTLGGSGNLSVNGSFSRSGSATIDSGFSSISLTQASGNLAPGALSAGALSFTTQDSSSTLLIDSPVESRGTLTINAAGALQVAGASASLAAAGDINAAARSVDIAAPVLGAHLVLSGTQGLTLRDSALLLSTVASGDAIVLDAAGTGPFVNTVGASVLDTAGGRWLVYSADPRADTIGGLAASFRQYNAPYGSTTPLGSGNGLLYSLAPVLSVGLQGSVAKVYDATTSASLSPANFTQSGALSIDNVVLNTPSAGVFADKNVGSGKTVLASGLTATVTDAAAGFPVYGLQFSGTASGAVGSITPAPLAVTGLTALNKVYDGSNSAVIGGSAVFTPLGSDNVTLAGSSGATFADKNVGSAKPVSLASFTLGGADAGNYTLQLPAGLSADITPATLTYVATPASSVVGTLPALGGTVSGFVGGETLATATTGQLSWATPATVGSPAGQYAITGSGLSASNYVFTQAPGNATALTLQLPITPAIVATATSPSTTSIAQALAVVATPVEMSTPTSGRVLDVVQTLAVGDAGSSASPTYDNVNLSQMQRDEIQSLLAARANFKRKVFDGGIGKLKIDPALADVRGCRTVVELTSGNCLLTAALKQEIESERARLAAQAAAAQATAKKPQGRRVVQAVLPTIQRKLALLIGVNRYQDKRIPQLKGAVPDARAVRDVLENHLGYETTVVEDPGREAMVRAFNKLALEAGPDDSVVIYYAGHGVVVPQGKEELGYWVPGDGDVDKPETWLSNSDIAKLVALVGARQVLLVSDSCYSGTLAGSERVQVDVKTDAAELLKRKAVVVMSSGGDEPVADVGREGHSVFAWYLMQSLKKLSNWEVGGNVFESVRTAVSRTLPQTPQYGASRSAGHQGNTDYLFEQREIEKASEQP